MTHTLSIQIDSVCVAHEARKWALDGITQHSLEVTGVAGDHLGVTPLRYTAEHRITQAVEGYLEGRYFWGVFWVSRLYAKNKYALAVLLHKVHEEIKTVSVYRIIIVTESPSLSCLLQDLGVDLLYAPTLFETPCLDQRYVFEYASVEPLLGALDDNPYDVTVKTCEEEASTAMNDVPKLERYGWVATHKQGPIAGYIELGIRNHQAYLRLLYTDATVRKQGIAQRLTHTALTYAAYRNCTLCTVETLSYQASEFYEKQGFSKVMTIEGLSPMCVSTPSAIPHLTTPLSFIFLTRPIP